MYVLDPSLRGKWRVHCPDWMYIFVYRLFSSLSLHNREGSRQLQLNLHIRIRLINISCWSQGSKFGKFYKRTPFTDLGLALCW